MPCRPRERDSLHADDCLATGSAPAGQRGRSSVVGPAWGQERGWSARPGLAQGPMLTLGERAEPRRAAGKLSVRPHPAKCAHPSTGEDGHAGPRWNARPRRARKQVVEGAPPRHDLLVRRLAGFSHLRGLAMGVVEKKAPAGQSGETATVG